MFKSVEDVSNYTDEQIWEHIKETSVIVGGDSQYESYCNAKKIVDEYEREEMAVAQEIWNRLRYFEPEDGDIDLVYDTLSDLMSDSAASGYKWDHEYKQFWIPSYCY